MKEFIFGKSKRNKPDQVIPSKKTDLLSLSPDKNVLVWFGHSSYFMQIDGRKILVDPVFSGAASPVKFTTNSFEGTDVYTPEEFPEIDYLFISHDHWDHLDYETMVKMRPQIKKVITGLGTGAHLEQWGFDKNSFIEKDWNEQIPLDSGFSVTILPARHFAGRGFKRNKALWVSFAFKTPTMNIYIGGDSGYDTHFAKIGETYGPFDLALLECGQYDKSWKYIHMMPEEVVTAAQELKAKRLMPVHWAKFSLGNHAWDEPILRVTAAAKQHAIPLLTPMIGEEVNLKDTTTVFPAWWETVR
jgi:L-ascorbate metabolism protein UlaG (beta-lactamase superfamily)